MPVRSAVASEAVWTAADVADPTSWSLRLSDEQSRELVSAARELDDGDRTPDSLVRADFDLPSLRSEIMEWTTALTVGRGFFLIRGFPISELTPRQIELGYLGLGLQLGTPVSQNAAGDLLGHVQDEGVVRTDPSVRLYQTSQRQDFHSDGADIVGLLCLQKARCGGESRIASASSVYNRILEYRPDLVEVLYEPMFWDRNGEESPGDDPYFALPVLSDVAGSPRMFFIGWYIRDAQRHLEVPRLTQQQLEAIELVEETANDLEIYLEMDFEPGDIQFLSNAKILHSREAFEDHAEVGRRRHLLRLWLAAHEFASVDDVLRGGIPPREEG
jgi:Taurine catabolism dioxygenase TauD, TfdA family